MAPDFVDSLVAREAYSGPAQTVPLVRLIGGPTVVYDRQHRDVPEGSKRLLVFLALHRGPLERRYAAGVLWPAGTDVRAAGNLRSALWRLHQAGIDLLSTEKNRLSLHERVLVDIDLVGRWAKRLISGLATADDLAWWPDGLDAFDLLPGWYDDWVLVERERMHQRVLHALEAMSIQLVAAGRCAEGVEAALLAVRGEPLRESAQRVLLAAHLAEGNWVEARRALDTYRELLRTELGVEPDPRLAAMLKADHYGRPLSHQYARPELLVPIGASSMSVNR